MKIKGSVALITGGAQGIGREICKALLERGAKVSVLDVNKQIGQEQVKSFQNTYGQDSANFISCDVANKKEMEAAFRKSWDFFGHIDIVCNNAGIFRAAEVENGFWDKMIDVNVKGVVHGTILGIKYLSTNGGMGRGGTIINVASIAGLIPAPDLPIYSATKHAVVGLTRSLEGLYSSDGIRINCICPSFTDTSMVTEKEGGLNNPQFQDTITAKYIRTFGLLRPELIASGVIQLIEDDTKNAAVMRVTKQKGIDYKKYIQSKL